MPETKQADVFLYHSVPTEVFGNTLYPLNVLKEKHPRVYEKEVQKYLGREHVMQQHIPILDCLWNDVLHFSAVHPAEVKNALIQAGRSPDFTMKCYQVERRFIDPKNAVIYLYAHADELHDEDFIPYSPERVLELSSLPQMTKEYYKETIQGGGRPLLYHLVPHVLYKGNLEILDLPIITV